MLWFIFCTVFPVLLILDAINIFCIYVYIFCMLCRVAPSQIANCVSYCPSFCVIFLSYFIKSQKDLSINLKQCALQPFCLWLTIFFSVIWAHTQLLLHTGCVSLSLPRLPKLPDPFEYTGWATWAILAANKEIQPQVSVMFDTSKLGLKTDFNGLVQKKITKISHNRNVRFMYVTIHSCKIWHICY